MSTTTDIRAVRREDGGLTLFLEPPGGDRIIRLEFTKAKAKQLKNIINEEVK